MAFHYSVTSKRTGEEHGVYSDPHAAMSYVMSSWELEKCNSQKGENWVKTYFDSQVRYEAPRFFIHKVSASEHPLKDPMSMTLEMSTPQVQSKVSEALGVDDLWAEDAPDPVVDAALGRDKVLEQVNALEGVRNQELGWVYVVQNLDGSPALGFFADPVDAFSKACSSTEFTELVSSGVDPRLYFYDHSVYTGKTFQIVKALSPSASTPKPPKDHFAIHLRASLRSFVENMEKSLVAQGAKSVHWKDESYSDLWRNFYAELHTIKKNFDQFGELKSSGDALDHSDLEDSVKLVQASIAEASNYLMMVHDNLDSELLVENLDRMLVGKSDRHDRTVQKVQQG